MKQIQGFYFNFTVLNISVDSSETSSCSLQGLYMGEIIKGHNYIIKEMCSDFSVASQSAMSTFHTRRSNLIMVAYWYYGFSSINATVSVNTTKYPGIYLYICTFRLYCTDRDRFSKFDDFIARVTQHTRLEFDLCKSDSKTQGIKLPAGDCVVLILSDSTDSIVNLNKFCKITLMTEVPWYKLETWVRKNHLYGDHKIAYIDGFLEEENYIEMLSHKDCFSSKHFICQKILNDPTKSDFNHFKFVKRFKQYLSGSVDTVYVKMKSGNKRNQVNIMIIGLKEKRITIKHALITHQLNLTFYDLILSTVLRFGTHYGVDLMLSTDRNVQIGPQYRHNVCSVTGCMSACTSTRS